MPATYYFHRETTHYCRSSLILALLLLSNLHLRAYSIPALQIVEGQNLNLAVAVENVSAARMQLPSEQFSGPAVPIAPPTPAIDAKVYFDSGVTSLGKLDYNKAIIEFSEAIRLDAHFTPAYLGRANAYSNQGNLDEAIRDYCEDPILPLPTTIEVLCTGIRALSNKAISDFTEAIRLDPNYAIAYENRGVFYFHTGKRAKANADFATAETVGVSIIVWRKPQHLDTLSARCRSVGICLRASSRL